MPPALQQCQAARRRNLIQFFVFSLAALGLKFILKEAPTDSLVLAGRQLEYYRLIESLLAIVVLASLLALLAAGFQGFRHHRYRKAQATLSSLLESQDLNQVKSTIAAVATLGTKEPLIQCALDSLRLAMNQHLDRLTRQDLQNQLVIETSMALRERDQRLADLKSQTPLVKTEATLRQSLATLKQRRQDLALQWEHAYAKMSWWNKLTLEGGPDFHEMDNAIQKLETMHTRLLKTHADDFLRLDKHFEELKSRALRRLIATKQQIEHYIASEVAEDKAMPMPLKAGLWFSALSVPVSAWEDVSTAGNIYDALRDVNGNFADMTDSEIWWQTLFMPAEQFVGLASLAKGAYFEQLVAADTGGALFEHFNNPGTDIVIDSVAFQIKATDSVSYINTVDPDIPVIATSEVAEVTCAINSGYSDTELERSVELALGGSVFDIQDTAVDALLAGVGGLGLFATLQGINHASQKYNNGGDGVEAVFEGLGVAIEGTARALVGTAELGYKVLTSRPSRFVGRTLMAGLNKLDQKLMGTESNTK